MVGGDLKGFFHALTECKRGNDHNKLTPALLLVPLEQRIDIPIPFDEAAYHLPAKTLTTASTASVWYCCILKLNFILVVHLLLQHKKAVKIALVQAVLYQPVFFILGFCVELCLLGADFTGAGQQLFAVKFQKTVQTP